MIERGKITCDLPECGCWKPMGTEDWSEAYQSGWKRWKVGGVNVEVCPRCCAIIRGDRAKLARMMGAATEESGVVGTPYPRLRSLAHPRCNKCRGEGVEQKPYGPEACRCVGEWRVPRDRRPREWTNRPEYRSVANR